MFKFFSNKKKKEVVRLEKQDSFYQAGGDDDLVSEEEDNNNMNDEEYRRRVTEEIAKRKSLTSGKKVATPTSGAATPSPTASSKPSSAPSTHGKSPTNASKPSATTPSNSRPTSTAVPAGSGRPASGAPAAQSVGAMRPNPATSPATSPTAVATSQRAAPTGTAATTAPVRSAAAAAGPVKVAVPVGTASAASTTRPAVPVPAATTPTSTAKPVTTPTSTAKPATTSAPATPASPPASASAGAVPFVPDPKGVQQLVSMGFSVPTVHYALRVRKNRADHAAEFLLEHSEESINRMIANAAKRAAEAQPAAGGAAVPAAAAVTTSTTSAAAKVVTPPPVSTVTATSVSTAAPPRSLSPIAPPLTSAADGPSSYSSSSSPAASSSDNSPRVPGGDVAVQAAMASIIAKREALKKKQAADQLRREASMRKVPAESPPKSSGDSSAASGGTAAPKPAVYDRLSEYKTKGQVAFENQEAEDRERRESQERRRKALAAGSNPTSPNGSNPPEFSDAAPSSSSESIVRPSASAAPLRRANSASGTTFENLFLKKTKSMIIKEKMDEEEKALQEKKAKRLSSGEGESEVFDKLYAKKLKAQELAEKIEQEEKARLAKVDAQTAGKVGAALPPRDSSPLLKKTKSALFRELDIADSKARFEVLQLLEKEKQPTPRRRSNSFSSDRGSVTARSVDGSVSVAARRFSGGLSRNGSGNTAGNGDSGDTTSDTEDDAGEANGAGKQSGTVSSLSSPRLVDAKVVPIQGLVPRVPMNYKVVETPDHRWEGRVCAPWRDVGNMIVLRGTYPEKAQCVAITAASAPPTYAVQTKNCICKVCEEPFNKYLKAENCRNCGQLVCPDCSTESWPQSMLPETYNETKSPFLRVCRACDQVMERFANALKSGDLEVVQALYKAGNVNLHHPYTSLPESPYPIHCAAASGNVKVLQWLVEEQYCLVRDMNTGAHLTNSMGHTVLAVAALRGDKATMHYCVNALRCSTADVTDLTALQRGLHAALEAPGPLPSLTLRRTAAAPAASVRRYEKMQSSREEPSPDPSPSAPSIRTDTLLSKAADLNNRLKSPGMLSRSSSTSATSPVKPPLAPSGSTPVTPLGGVTGATAGTGVATVVAAGEDAVPAAASEPPAATEPVVQAMAEEASAPDTASTAPATTTVTESAADSATATTGDGTQGDASADSVQPVGPSTEETAALPSTVDAPAPTSGVPAPVEESRSAEGAPSQPTEADKEEPVKDSPETAPAQSEPAVASVPPLVTETPAATDATVSAESDPSNRVAEQDQAEAAAEPPVPSSAAVSSSEVVEDTVAAEEVGREATGIDEPDAAPQPPAATTEIADGEQVQQPEEAASAGSSASTETTQPTAPEADTPALVIETSTVGAVEPATEDQPSDATKDEAQPSPQQASTSNDSSVAPSPPKSGSPRQASSRPRQSPQGPPAGLRRLNSMKTEPPLTKAPSVRLGMPGGAGLPRAQSYRDNGALTSPPK